jgi:outer membrane protein assembly factor BamB
MIQRLTVAALIFAAAAVIVLPATAAEKIRRFIAADSSKQRIAIIDEKGDIEWEYKIGSLHDLHVLPSGNVLFQTSMTRLLEVDPSSGRIVWEYDAGSSNGNKGRPVEVHAFQRLASGATMIVESGPARIIEVDAEGKLLKEIALKVEHPHVHRDTRLARKIDNGNYLVCHEADGFVREYDSIGKIVWDFEVPLFGREPANGHGLDAFGNQCFSVLRLKNGNTLIGTGNGHSVLEVTPEKKMFWSIHQNDLEGIQLAWVTSLQVLPGGNILIGNCHAGPDNPQIIEVNRDKKVVWKFHDFKRFGNSLTNSQILFN